MPETNVMKTISAARMGLCQLDRLGNGLIKVLTQTATSFEVRKHSARSNGSPNTALKTRGAPALL